MGILEELSPYMTLLRFTDSTGIERSYYESVYSNILESGNSTPSPQLYGTSDATGGLFRRGSFNEDYELTQLDCFFNPVVDGTQWRATVLLPNGRFIGASEFKEVSGADEHQFVFDPPLALDRQTEYLFGIEAQDATQQASAYYNHVPNDVIEGGFDTDDAHIREYVNPQFDGQEIVFGTGFDGHIRRMDDTGTLTVWDINTGGTGAAFDSRVFAIRDDEVLASVGSNLKTLDYADGSEIWSYDLASNPLHAFLRGDLLYLHLTNGNLAIADLAAATPPNVVVHNLGIIYRNSTNTGDWKGGPFLSVSPDGSALYLVAMFEGEGVVRKYLTSGDFSTYEWQFTPNRTLDGVDVTNDYVYVISYDGLVYELYADAGDVRTQYGITNPYFVHATEDGFVYVTRMSGPYYEIRTSDGAIRSFDPWGAMSYNDPNPHTIVADRYSLYIGSEEDYHRLARVDRETLEMLWETGDWYYSSTPTRDYSAHLAVRYATTEKRFPILVSDQQLAMRLHRRVDWYPLTNDNLLRGHRHWRTFVELTPLVDNLHAVIPEVGIARGQGRQVAVQRQDDLGDWVDLNRAERNVLSPGTATPLRLVIEPADIVEEWSSRPIADVTDYRTDVSGNRIGWPNSSAGAGMRTGYTTGYGRYMYQSNNAYDDYGHANLVESKDQQGDVEFRAYSWHNSYYMYFFFRVSESRSVTTGFELKMSGGSLYLDNPSNTQIFSTGFDGDSHPLLRAIWKDDRFLLFSNGRLICNLTGIPNDDSAFRYFGFNGGYPSSNVRVYAFRGRGMAVEPGADLPLLNFASFFHETAE